MFEFKLPQPANDQIYDTLTPSCSDQESYFRGVHFFLLVLDDNPNATVFPDHTHLPISYIIKTKKDECPRAILALLFQFLVPRVPPDYHIVRNLTTIALRGNYEKSRIAMTA